jgi:hypothetical protein
MMMKGAWAQKPDKVMSLNVSSAQSKQSEYRKDFSTTTGIEGGYKGYYCFENYWQSGKVFEFFSEKQHIDYNTWWKKQVKGVYNYPGTYHKVVMYSNYDGKKRDYLASRKEIFVPEYYELMKNTHSFVTIKKNVNKGKDVVDYDFDGPKSEDGDPLCLEITLEMLKESINNYSHSFGHGYVVAAALAGFVPEEYCK